MKVEYFECACYSHDHFIKMVSDNDLPHHIIIAVHLAPLPWYKRIKSALLYIFGKRSRYGDFEECILRPEVVVRMKKFLHDTVCVTSPMPINDTELPEGV